MNTLHPFLRTLLLALAASASSLAAAEIIGGPNGGRILHAGDQALEFFVNDAREANIVFLDAGNNPISPGEAKVRILAELPDGRAQIDLDKSDSGFVSTSPLPEGDPYRLVVLVRTKPDARPANFRIDLNLSVCGGCDRGEYACTCGH